MKRMVIYIDGSPNDRDSLLCAARLSERLGARLSVMHLRLPTANVDSVKRAIAIAERAQEDARRAFQDVCGDLPFTEWLGMDENVEDAIRRESLLHDLTILQRVSAQEGPEVFALNTALFDTGGPVLVTPPRAPNGVGEVAAVVWNRTVQSARAVRSSIPLLRETKKVVILTNSANPTAEPAALSSYLASHGIGTEHRAFDAKTLSARGRGRAILAACDEIGADLLVMGAYGENRLHAIFGLGRATQKVVSAARIPVFIQR